MISRYDYAYEKLTEVERTLAIGPYHVKSRLWDAFLQFHMLAADDFPDYLKKDFEWVMSKLTSKEPKYDSNGKVEFGSVDMSLRSMHYRTGARIATKLVDMKEELGRIRDGTSFRFDYSACPTEDREVSR